MTKKALESFAKDYLRLQFHVAQAALNIEHPIESNPLKYFQDICATLAPREHTFFQNYVFLGNAFNDLLRYAIAETDKFLKGYFMISSSNCLYYIREITPKGKSLPPDIPISRITAPEKEAWNGVLSSQVFTPLMYYFSYKALMRCLSRTFAPRGVDFAGLLCADDIMADALSDLEKIVASKPFIGSMRNVCTGADMGKIETYMIDDAKTRHIESYLNGFDLFNQYLPLNVVDLAAKLRHEKFDAFTKEMEE